MINVMVAINNPRNGMPSNRISGIDIEGFLYIDSAVYPDPRCTIGSNWIRLHAKRFRFSGSKSWVGNWCWDSLSMTETECAAMLAHCINFRAASGHPFWAVDCAHGEAAIAIADKARAGVPVTAEEIVEAMKAEKVGVYA